MGVFPSGQWGQTVNLLLSASVVRIHPRPPKNLNVRKYAEVFVLLQSPTHRAGGFEQHRPAEQSGVEKSPCGAFLAARLAISTRAHQKTSTYEITLRFLFCSKTRLTGRVDSNNSDDRRQRQKQGGAVGAATSGMRVPPKARRSRWEPRPGFRFTLRGSHNPPSQTLFHRLLLKMGKQKPPSGWMVVR